MGLHKSFFGFSVSLFLFGVSLCYADDKTIQVVGIGECADCKANNIKTVHAFSGLHVTIDCKVGNGAIKTRGKGKLEKDGNFAVSLPKEMVKDGKLKEECYAQLHTASAAPCPTHNGIEGSKIVVTKSENNEKHTLKPVENLKFSTALCTSAFLWSHFKFPFPHIPIFKHPDLPPVPAYKHPDIPPVPVYKQPDLPPIPVPKKPLLPHIPLYKPIPPLFKKSFPEIPLFPPSFPHP